MNFIVNKPKNQKQPDPDKNKKLEPVIESEELPAGFTGSLNDMFGIWKDKPVSLDKIREQQWVRKTK